MYFRKDKDIIENKIDIDVINFGIKFILFLYGILSYKCVCDCVYGERERESTVRAPSISCIVWYSCSGNV